MTINRFLALAVSISFACVSFLSCSSDADSGGSSSSDTEGNGGDGSSSSGIEECGLSNGTLTDSRDGKTYKWVKICTQTWMAKNLNFEGPGSICYQDAATYCNTYGRLYRWTSAMATACPSGWHLPSADEWKVLTDYIGSGAATKLKATHTWKNQAYGNGTDDYGFAALPGGSATANEIFSGVGEKGFWWSSTEYSTLASEYQMFYNSSDVDWHKMAKDHYSSVRCVKD
jgi:uncharacterized protein (TIGR02145 family)